MKKIEWLFLFITVSFASWGQGDEIKKTVTIPEGKVGIIGYGSLMSKKSMETTLGRPYNENYLIVHLDGFERRWNYARLNDGKNKPKAYYLNQLDTIYPTYTIALNIKPMEGKFINACLFIIEQSDLAFFDKREYGYTRLLVNKNIREYKVIGDVYAYTALPEFDRVVTNDPRENIIAKQYIDIVESSFEFGEKFKDEFFKTTIPYNVEIVKVLNRKAVK